MKLRRNMLAAAIAAAAMMSALDLAAQTYSAKEVLKIEGLDKPECVVFAEDGDLLISNMDTDTEGWWEEDKTGFVTRVSPDGKEKQLRWAVGTKKVPLHGPKGMTVLGDHLYMADSTCVKRLSLAKPCDIKVFEVPRAEQINDMATDGKAVYATDTAKALIYRIDAKGKVKTITAPTKPNGLTFHDGTAYVVSVGEAEIFAFDPKGKKPLKSLGLAEHFEGLDGIEVLDDGTLIVSDLIGGKLCAVSPDRKTVTKLAELEWPADLAVDRKTLRVYVPQVKNDCVVVFQLKKK